MPFSGGRSVAARPVAPLPFQGTSDGVAYLPPTVTTSWCRPLRRLALRTLRPALVAIRARNPCLLMRLRLRGR